MEWTSDNPSPTGAFGSPPRNSTLKPETNALGMPSRSEVYHRSSDASLFSCSLPVLEHEKLNLLEPDHGLQSADSDSLEFNKFAKSVDGNNAVDDFDLLAIGRMLPGDEEELLAGIIDDFDISRLTSQVEEMEDYDVFGTGGGMELDFDLTESINISMAKTSINGSYVANGTGQYGVSHGAGTIFGEHPYGEHPSRTLFVRNINSNVEDAELRALFEQYGDIRQLYTACKHRGFVMISYYDIRAARTAMRALQNKPLRRRKLDIHFSIPKDNPSDKDINQGTLVVFNLDPSVSNDELHQIFGAYGELKEIRETPHKRHHKFVEFYDVRAAEAALKSLNRSDIAGKRIKLEPSRPGGARRNLMQQLSQDLEQNETKSYRNAVGSSITNSPPGMWVQFSSPTNNSPLQDHSHSLNFAAINRVAGNQSSGLASILSPLVSSSTKFAPIGKDYCRISHASRAFSGTSSKHGVAFQYPHSFLEHGSATMPNDNQDTGTVSSLGHSTMNAPGIGTLAGQQYLWSGSNPCSEHGHSSAWTTQSARNSFTLKGQSFAHSDHHGSLHHHAGSYPQDAPFESYVGYSPESPESSFMNSVAFGGMGVGRNGHMLMNVGAQAASNLRAALSGTKVGNGSPNFRMMSTQRLSPVFVGTSSYSGPVLGGFEGLIERGCYWRVENNTSQLDSKKQYHLDLEKIIGGEDTRTTLMIKNIPNKYTSNMLLAEIDETHKGTYDFFYLPIDFKNKCNVGYAFINMVSPSRILLFYEAFDGKKWEKFNSEKVASLAYARIQGKAGLVAHFQNSSLMNEDKRCHPILFHSEGPEAGSQEPFPPINVNTGVHQADGAYVGNSSENTRKDLNEIAENSERASLEG